MKALTRLLPGTSANKTTRDNVDAIVRFMIRILRLEDLPYSGSPVLLSVTPNINTLVLISFLLG